ncbi:SdpI family protein [Halobacillus sp. B23F22_1]|uniref:SdpI family protein n=1 Tax=Halobacillus sp. B23F22_1 TaxID=3459514 RepID=UPI00373E3EEE
MRRYMYIWFLIAVSFGVSLFVLPYLPEQVAMHWNIYGEADQFWNKSIAVFFIPLLMLGMAALLVLLPKIDPNKANFKKFSTSYQMIVHVILVFLFLLHVVTLGYNLGWAIDISLVIFPAVGCLFIVLGIFMPRIQPNYFMGIRTPWTLADDKTWRKTHELGGKVFVLAGVLILLVSFLPGSYKLISFLVIIIIMIFLLMISSYRYFKKSE